MSLSGYQQQFTINLAKLIAFASSLGVGLTMGDAFRSNDQQLLFYYGRTFDDEQKLVKTKRRSWTLTGGLSTRLLKPTGGSPPIGWVVESPAPWPSTALFSIPSRSNHLRSTQQE